MSTSVIPAKNIKSAAIRQRKFAMEYFKSSGNASVAAQNLGYKDPKKQGYRMMKDPEVHKEIQKLEEKYIGESIVSLEWKLERLKEAAHHTSSSEAPFISAGIKAIGELNKMQGHHAPTKSLNVNLQAELKEVREMIDSYDADY